MDHNVLFRFHLKHVFFHSKVSWQRSTYARSHWIRAHGPRHPDGQFWCKSLLFKLQKNWSVNYQENSWIVATRCQILRIQCIKFDFGSAPDPTGGAYSAPPDPLAGFKGPYFYL